MANPDLAVLLIVSLCVSLVVSLITGLILIPELRRKKAGQMIREDGPKWHQVKQGTPTMGGLIFITGIVAACMTVGFGEMWDGRFGHLTVITLALVFGAIGMFDDYVKLSRKQNMGLGGWQKFTLQLIAALGFVAIMHLRGNLTTALYIPIVSVTWDIPIPLYYIFTAFVIVGTVNSVNITDGIDGMLTGVTIPVGICFLALAYTWGHTSVGIYAAAMTGGLLGFLIFNFHPAKVFMGDTGSLFLGASVCGLAFAIDTPLILIILGFVYIIEALSDIIQVSYYKLTKGKRVFKMAPIHHHFEMLGWNEYKLFTVFTIVSAVFCTIAYYAVSGRH